MTRVSLVISMLGVDVWCKHKREPVVDHLYHRNYHEDDGFGVDAYNVGTSLGCGGGGDLGE